MAEHSDGSIIIDTELDTSDVKKSIDDMKQKMDGLSSQLKTLQANLEASFSKFKPIFDAASSGADDLADGFTNAANAAQSGFSDTKVITDLQNRINVLEGQLGSLSKSLENLSTQPDPTVTPKVDTSETDRSISDTKNNLQGLSDQFKELGSTFGSSFNDFKPVFTAVSAHAKALSGDLAQIERAAQNGFANAGSVLKFHSALDKAEQDAQELTLQLDELGRKQLPTRAYTMYAEELKKAQEELAKLIARQDMMSDLGVKESSAQWKRVALQVEQTQGVIIDLENDMQALRQSGDAFTLGSNTDEYKALSTQLEAARSAIERNYRLIDSEKIEQAQLNVLTAQEAVIAAKTTDERTRALEQLRAAQAALSEIAAESVTVPTKETGSTAPPEEDVSRWGRLKAAMAGAGKAGLSFLSTVGKIGAKVAGITFKGIINGLKSFGKNGKNAVLTANGLTKSLTSLKTMLIGRLKRTFINEIVKGVKEGINALTQYSSAFNGVMSNIKNRSTELGANLSVSVASFISAVEPFITTLLESLSKAATYLNAFIGMLQGKSTITVAKKQTDSYADSLDNAADSAKELKAQVYSFDDLNKAQSTDTSKKDKKTGADLFEDKSIEDIVPTGLLEALEKIKDAILNGDWRLAGQLIGEGLNSIVQTIDDFINNTLRPKGVEWAGNIAELLNGIVDTLDFGNIGKTIADGINAIADILNTFLTTFDFVALGKGIGEGINGLFENIDWNLLGTMFANNWNALIDLIYGLVTTIKWDMVGDKLAEFVQAFADNLKIEELADAIGIGLNGIVTLLQHFLDGVDWDGIATRLGDGINRIFNQIDWSAVGKLLSDGVIKALSFINTAIETVDWFAIGADISEALNAIDWPGIFGELGRLLSDLLVAALDILLGCVEKLDWFKLGKDLWDSIVAIVVNIDWNGIISKAFELLGAAVGGIGALLAGLCVKVWESLVSAWNSTKSYFDKEIEAAGGDVWKGIGNGILKAIVNIGKWILDKILIPFADGFAKALGMSGIDELGVSIYEGIIQPIGDFFSKIGTWIKENIFDPFVNGFKKLFGINSPSTVMAEMGGYLIDGLKQGISDTWHKITDFFTETLPQLGQKIKDKWEDIKKDTSEKWGEIKEKISSAFDSAKTTVENTASKLKSSLSTTCSTIKTTVSQKWTELKSDTSQKWEEIKNKVSSAFTSAKEKVTSTASTLKSNLASTMSSIKSDTVSKWESIKADATSKWESLKNTATQKFESIKSTVSQKWNNLKSDLQNTNWNSSGENLVNGLRSGIENSWDTITSTVQRLGGKLTAALNQVFQINSPSRVWAQTGEYLDAGLNMGISSNSDTILKNVSNLARSVNDSMTIDSPAIGGIDNHALSTIDRFSERFDGLIDRLTVVSDMLRSIGNFTTPAVAAGAYVPYAVHANTFSPSRSVTDASDALQTVIDGQGDMLIEIMQTLTQILTAIRTKNLSLDAGVLSETVTRLQKKHDIDYGGF